MKATFEMRLTSSTTSQGLDGFEYEYLQLRMLAR